MCQNAFSYIFFLWYKKGIHVPQLLHAYRAFCTFPQALIYLTEMTAFPLHCWYIFFKFTISNGKVVLLPILNKSQESLLCLLYDVCKDSSVYWTRYKIFTNKGRQRWCSLNMFIDLANQNAIYAFSIIACVKLKQIA